MTKRYTRRLGKAHMITKTVPYEVDGQVHTGFLVHEKHISCAPGILVCHQSPGITEHTRERAKMLAELGYVAFALDMYGQDSLSIDDPNERALALMQNPAEIRKRAAAGLGVLKDQVNVDLKRLAAIGHCFGGALALEMARLHSELRCVVAFHPGLSSLRERDDRPVFAKILVCAGVNDPLISQGDREHFVKLMNEAKCDWQMVLYGGTAHSFTDQNIDRLGLPGYEYHERSDQRSWAAMQQLLAETFEQHQMWIRK